MTVYRLSYINEQGNALQVLREEPAESAEAALMKMLIPHPERDAIRVDMPAPAVDRRVVLEERIDGGWRVVEELRAMRGGFAEVDHE